MIDHEKKLINVNAVKISTNVRCLLSLLTFIFKIIGGSMITQRP